MAISACVGIHRPIADVGLHIFVVIVLIEAVFVVHSFGVFGVRGSLLLKGWGYVNDLLFALLQDLLIYPQMHDFLSK